MVSTIRIQKMTDYKGGEISFKSGGRKFVEKVVFELGPKESVNMDKSGKEQGKD